MWSSSNFTQMDPAIWTSIYTRLWLFLCRFLMCDGGPGRLWRPLLTVSRVQFEPRRTDLTLAPIRRRTVGECLPASRPLMAAAGEDKGVNHTLLLLTVSPFIYFFYLALIWTCRLVGKAVKAQVFFFPPEHNRKYRQCQFSLCMGEQKIKTEFVISSAEQNEGDNTVNVYAEQQFTMIPCVFISWHESCAVTMATWLLFSPLSPRVSVSQAAAAASRASGHTRPRPPSHIESPPQNNSLFFILLHSLKWTSSTLATLPLTPFE